MLRLLPFCLLALSLAACGSEAPASAEMPHAAEMPPGAAAPADREQAAALEAALDTLETLVAVLEEIRSPVSAWNRAAEVARLTEALDMPALAMPEEEARRRFGPQVARFESLQARRVAQLERIEADPVIARVLYEEIAKAEAGAAD